MARPEPPEMPEGCHAEAVPDSEWRLVTGKRCRRKLSRTGYCPRDAVAGFPRTRYNYRSGKSQELWSYCEEHSYGRWIEDGQVMRWIAVENDA